LKNETLHKQPVNNITENTVEQLELIWPLNSKVLGFGLALRSWIAGK